MASTAPPYTAGSPPPAYNEVVKNIQDAAGKSPTHEKCREIVQGLSDQDRKVLVDTVKNGQAPPIPEDLQKKATNEMMHAIAQPESQHLLESTAQDVANAVKNIRGVFGSLKLKFQELDKLVPSDFLPTLKEHEETFSAIIRQSRSLAVNTSSQGTKFDESIIKTVGDEQYTIAQRRKVIQHYIQQTTTIKGDAEKMESDFVKFVRDFDDFVGTFGKWAESQQKTLGRQIEELNKEISRLQDLLAKLEKSMYGMGAAVVVGALAVKFAGMTGPAAPFITAIGGIIAGGAALALIGLGIAFAGMSLAVQSFKSELGDNQETETKAEIDANQKKRDSLTGQRDTIVAARGELMKLGKEKLDDLKTNINVLASYWQCAQNDAQQIDNWLAEGAEFANMPDYMKDQIDKSANSYKTMAKYLKCYADNLTIV